MAEGGKWSVTGQAEKLNVDVELWGKLTGGGDAEITPALVQFALFPAVAADLGRTIGTKIDPTRVEITF